VSSACASSGRVAAFFDVDGTLLAGPSLERRMFRALLRDGAIPVWNFALWAAEFVRLAPRGIDFARQANKMYLRGVSRELAGELAERVAGTGYARFFPEAVERVAWHAAQGHRIFLVSGTLEFLARCAARALQAALRRRGVDAEILVCAMRLEEVRGRWTGRINGAPMFGRAKAAAIRSLAQRTGAHLETCFAYGDSVQDRAMLECVGHAMAVNPSPAMRRVAVREGWRVVEWQETNERKTKSAALAGQRGGRLAERKAETLG
jgi:HAD superfamily hydrolase (TIGR01490 family)